VCRRESEAPDRRRKSNAPREEQAHVLRLVAAAIERVAATLAALVVAEREDALVLEEEVRFSERTG
jgi:hypothetical protein